jgi:hypothetical protein
MPDEHLRPWSRDRARRWHDAQPWLVGCNFIPSGAVNQLEMWQAATFDLSSIDRELGWAAAIGFNAVRVFLHDIPWREEADAFLVRIARFLDTAGRHGIATLFVLFDGVWDPFPRPGPQRAPRPGVHNSAWVQCPGVDVLRDPARHHPLADYVTGVVGRFRDDPRVLGWDVMNEPDNPNPAYGAHEPPDKAALALGLLEKAYGWARHARPAQPLTSAVWLGRWDDPAALSALDRFLLTESDVVSFHCYFPPDGARAMIAALERYGRPLLCTEFMSRPSGSTFEAILPILAEKRIGAFAWGLVAGRTQTIFPWDSWLTPYEREPEPWFHDVLRPDGTPYRGEEIDCIRALRQRQR